MIVKQINKRIKTHNFPKKRATTVEPERVSWVINTPPVVEEKVEEVKETVVEKTTAKKKKNKETKTDEDMNIEQMNQIEALAQAVNAPREVKVVKKDKGLIERTESSKIVLTEDNRQVLND